MSSGMDSLKHPSGPMISSGKKNTGTVGRPQELEKEIHRLNFKLDRAIKEKQTLSTLLARTSEDLEKSTEIIKKMFGRYLSTEVMNSLLEDPTALELGGEKRMVTIMMTDLRGFSELSERISPEQVVQMLNAYFEVMVDIILKHHGTINEIIGDALLVIFGAPQEMEDRTQRAVACAIDMQNAMAEVNDINRRKRLPDLEMGIGINETEVIVGNIGSNKRSKYAVVGSGVNLTSRIESYSVGGQILVSETVKQKIGHQLRIDTQVEVNPKGSRDAIRIYDVSGISGHHNLTLESRLPHLHRLAREIPVQYLLLEGKAVTDQKFAGMIVRLSTHGAQLRLSQPVAPMTNLQLELAGVDSILACRPFYAKVLSSANENGSVQVIRFTSVAPEVDAFFQAHLQYVSD